MAHPIFEKIRQRLVRQNRVYIMPTTRGVLFLSTLVVLVLTAATYNNNLIFILAFLLFSIFAVTMLQTHYNIKGVRTEFLSAEEAFAGDRLGLLFQITQKRARPKFALQLRSSSRVFKNMEAGVVDLSGLESSKPVRIQILAYRRGVHPLPEVILETFFPLGLFRAWKVFRPEGQLVIYPEAQGEAILNPTNSDYGEEELGLRTSPEGDFGELKPYKVGESYHQIAWKHFARTGNLYSKVHWGQEQHHYHILFKASTRPEEMLRQMSQWVKRAFEQNASFELELPNHKIGSGEGLDQARHCWRALAEFKVPR